MTTSGTTPTPTNAPVFDEDPYSPEILADPIPFQRRLLEAGPVAYLSRYGVHVLARYDSVKAALSNWQDLISGDGVGLNEPWRTTGLLESDPPRHDAPRDVLAGIMSARVLRSMTDECVREAELVIDAIIADHGSGTTVTFDGQRDIGAVLPVKFFGEAAGIDGTENMIPYADHVFNVGGPRNELAIKGEATAPALAEWAEHACQRESLKPRGFGSDIWAAADRGDIRHDQAALLTRSLVSAGIDTTVGSLSALLYAFAANPEAWDAVRADPALARVAFDELLRWESPVQMDFRKTATEVTFGDTTIPAGERVMICFGAANRDPRRWENPDKFDLSRDPSGHLAFGMGIHQCVGQHAARLQAECLVRVLTDRFTSIELAGPVVRHLNNTLRGWESIPLKAVVA
ncbi:cytochrome P450 [Nocardioides albidus]|uniref:Cytochrome P450 n=1 Tax=Nocardioides albidus TaxID=1517589 RepID=A0A5C4WRI6_9ACTN|nr:cytochrome P450 [Nocardioides albidus]TNM50807.1 cytochrome P450 [Nocardioides albidus]